MGQSLSDGHEDKIPDASLLGRSILYASSQESVGAKTVDCLAR